LQAGCGPFFTNTQTLHQARFAHLHELEHLLTDSVTGAGLLLAQGPHRHVLRVRAQAARRELGNMLIVAPTRGGKGLLATSQLLTWPGSVIVNDLKGDLFLQTAGYRQSLGQVYVIDPTGLGHRFDSLAGRISESALYGAARHLLHEPRENDGIVFTQRAAKMLTQLFLAGLIERRNEGHKEYNLLSYAAFMVNQPLREVALRLNSLDPGLATRFLDGALTQTDFTDDRFLLSAWGTLTARLYPLLTSEVVRTLSGSDFTAWEIMTSKTPVTIYLRWPEPELLPLAPLVRLVWDTLIHDLLTTYDRAGGEDCRPVLLLIDEAGRTGIPNLDEYATTVSGRGISLWIAIQALSQLEALYGRHRADTIRNNAESQLHYRQASHETARYLEERLGRRSDYAHSTTEHEGTQTSQGQVEQGVPLLTAQEITQLGDTELIGFHRHLPPFRAYRMDWRSFPRLVNRHALSPPPLSKLSPLAESPVLTAPVSSQTPPALASWHFDPQLFRKWPKGAALSRDVEGNPEAPDPMFEEH
jgi:type IV secretion system protein VirD4